MLTCKSEKCMTYPTFVYERVEYAQFSSISNGRLRVSSAKFNFSRFLEN